MTGPRALLHFSLLLASACLAETGDGEPWPAEVAGRADEGQRGPALADFAGSYLQVDAAGDPVAGSRLTVAVQGDNVVVQQIVDGHAGSVISGPLSDRPTEKQHTVSSSGGFSGESVLERRRTVTLRSRKTPYVIEEQVERYSWLVSYRVWEDWVLTNTLRDRLTLSDDRMSVEFHHSDSTSDLHTRSYRYVRE